MNYYITTAWLPIGLGDDEIWIETEEDKENPEEIEEQEIEEEYDIENEINEENK